MDMQEKLSAKIDQLKDIEKRELAMAAQMQTEGERLDAEIKERVANLEKVGNFLSSLTKKGYAAVDTNSNKYRQELEKLLEESNIIELEVKEELNKLNIVDLFKATVELIKRKFSWKEARDYKREFPACNSLKEVKELLEYIESRLKDLAQDISKSEGLINHELIKGSLYTNSEGEVQDHRFFTISEYGVSNGFDCLRRLVDNPAWVDFKHTGLIEDKIEEIQKANGNEGELTEEERAQLFLALPDELLSIQYAWFLVPTEVGGMIEQADPKVVAKYNKWLDNLISNNPKKKHLLEPFKQDEEGGDIRRGKISEDLMYDYYSEYQDNREDEYIFFSNPVTNSMFDLTKVVIGDEDEMPF